MDRALRYRGPVKVVETTGQWGVYSGERFVLGDGRSLADDLGVRFRQTFQDGERDTEAFAMPDVRITITPVSSTDRMRRVLLAAGGAAVAITGWRALR